MALSTASQAGTVGFTFSATFATGNDNLGLYGGGSATAGPSIMSVSYDPTQLGSCNNSTDYSYCTAPLGAGSVTASFVTTDINNVVHTFTETGGAPLLDPVSCPEGFCSNTGGGIHMYNSNGFAVAQFYAFGPDGRYLAGTFKSNLAWQPGVLATNEAYASQMLASIVGTDWFLSGPYENSDPEQGDFTPGDYFNVSNLQAVTPTAPEPSSWMTLAGGLFALGTFGVRRNKRRA